jgi:hypothetical protein
MDQAINAAVRRLIPTESSILTACPFCHNTTLQHHRL